MIIKFIFILQFCFVTIINEQNKNQKLKRTKKYVFKMTHRHTQKKKLCFHFSIFLLNSSKNPRVQEKKKNTTGETELSTAEE